MRQGGALGSLLLVMLLAGCSPTGLQPRSSTASGTAVPSDLRDVRYCEVIPSVTQGANVITSVYNTLGYNFCPPAQWNALTEETVNQAFGSQSAKLNGPRHWVIDQMEASGSSTTGQTFTFGGIEMGLRATLTTPADAPTVGDQVYAPNQVQRDTIWTYDAGKPIFVLTSPEGDEYVMQSYAQIADRTLTYAQLPSRARKLTLPAGWAYASRTLTAPLALHSNGLATVINDNLYNSYQLNH